MEQSIAECRSGNVLEQFSQIPARGSNEESANEQDH